MTPEPQRTEDMLRHGDRWVRVSAELVDQMSRGEWTPPVQCRIERQEGDVLELVFRTVPPSGDPGTIGTKPQS